MALATVSVEERRENWAPQCSGDPEEEEELQAKGIVPVVKMAELLEDIEFINLSNCALFQCISESKIIDIYTIRFVLM